MSAVSVVVLPTPGGPVRRRARMPMQCRGRERRPPRCAQARRPQVPWPDRGSSAAMLRAARREPSALLLATQDAGLLLYPFMEGSFAGRALLNLFGIVVLWLVVATVNHSRAITRVGWMLGAPATVLLVIQAATDSDALIPYSSAIEAALYFYAAASLIGYVMRDHNVTRDELFAVGATFTLVAWAFADVYVVCQAIYPASFTAAANAEAPRRW